MRYLVVLYMRYIIYYKILYYDNEIFCCYYGKLLCYNEILFEYMYMYDLEFCIYVYIK